LSIQYHCLGASNLCLYNFTHYSLPWIFASSWIIFFFLACYLQVTEKCLSDIHFFLRLHISLLIVITMDYICVIPLRKETSLSIGLVKCLTEHINWCYFTLPLCRHNQNITWSMTGRKYWHQHCVESHGDSSDESFIRILPLVYKSIWMLPFIL
jgi:hypothetical protein